jgi:hypothetical protein
VMILCTLPSSSSTLYWWLKKVYGALQSFTGSVCGFYIFQEEIIYISFL